MTRGPAVVVMVVVWLGVACGGGSGGGSAPDSQGPAPQPSPSPTASPAPQPTPSPTPSHQPTPGPQPTPTPPGGGSPLALDIARTDLASECDGLVPGGAPAQVTLATSMPADATCLGGTGDGTGHVAIGVRLADVTTWTVFAPDGARTGEASGPGLHELARQASGWHGVISTPLDAPFQTSEHVVLGADGTVRLRTPVAPAAGFLVNEVRLAADPAGGSALAVAATAVAGNHPSRVEGVRFGGDGAPVHGSRSVASVDGPTVAFLGGGVSRGGGMILAYRTPGTFAWTWLARDGSEAAKGEALQVDLAASDPVQLEPLLDGGVAVRFAGTWSAVIPHLGTAASPAPDWLAGRPGTALRLTRGNRGYAVLPPPGEALPDCAQIVELRAPTGRLCGRVTIRDGASACTGAAVEQGWDGSLIQQSPRAPCSGGTCTCGVRVWPRLLAAP